MTDAPFTASFDLGTVRDRSVEVTVAPNQAERAAIADWLGVESLGSLKAVIELSQRGTDEYVYSGRFEADVVQACVVTLEPVPSHLSGEIRRLFRLLPRSSARRRAPADERLHAMPAAIDLSTADEEDPELLDHPMIDLAAPLLEELSLALDPYPRAPGAAFEAPVEPPEPTENPFAVLEKLKAPTPANRSTGKAKAPPKRQPGKKKG